MAASVSKMLANRTRDSQETHNWNKPGSKSFQNSAKLVIPVKTGIQWFLERYVWTPAFAGETKKIILILPEA